MERAEYDFNLKTVPLPPVDPARRSRRERIVASSRERYARGGRRRGGASGARMPFAETEPESPGRQTENPPGGAVARRETGSERRRGNAVRAANARTAAASITSIFSNSSSVGRKPEAMR